MFYRKRFEKENPHLTAVSGSPYEPLLLWAFKEGYCLLVQAPTKEYYYSQEELDKAKMWAEKEDFKYENE